MFFVIQVDFLDVSGPRMRIEDGEKGGRMSFNGEDRTLNNAQSPGLKINRNTVHLCIEISRSGQTCVYVL